MPGRSRGHSESTESSDAPSSVSEGQESTNWGAQFWVTISDPVTKTTFYANPATGDCRWKVDDGTLVLPKTRRGEWWELENEAGLTYYWHSKSGHSTWTRPIDGLIIPMQLIMSGSGAQPNFVQDSPPSDTDQSSSYRSRDISAIRNSIVCAPPTRSSSSSTRSDATFSPPALTSTSTVSESWASSNSSKGKERAWSHTSDASPRSAPPTASETAFDTEDLGESFEIKSPTPYYSHFAASSISLPDVLVDAFSGTAMVSTKSRPVRKGQPTPTPTYTPLPRVSSFLVYAQQNFSTPKGGGGLFRRRKPTVSLDTRVVWQKDPLDQPLHALPRHLRAQAISCFEGLRRCMADQSESAFGSLPSRGQRKMAEANFNGQWSASQREDAHHLLTCGMQPLLRNELYAQAIKQISGCPTAGACSRGLRLLEMYTAWYPPQNHDLVSVMFDLMLSLGARASLEQCRHNLGSAST